MVLCFWSRGHLARDGVSHLFSVRHTLDFLSLAIVCTGGSLDHGDESCAWIRTQVGAWVQSGACRSCHRVKRRLSMLIQWPMQYLFTSVFFFAVSWFDYLWTRQSSLRSVPWFLFPSFPRQMTALVAPVSVGRFLVTSDYVYYGGSRVFDRNIIIALGLRSHPSITYVCLSSCGGVLDNCVHVGFR